MKFTLLLPTFSLFALALFDCLPRQGLTLVLPQRLVVLKYGPLYESVKLLIAAQSFGAEQLWNNTKQQIYDQAHYVHAAQETVDEYQRQVSVRLERIFGGQKSNAFRYCFKQYELDVAHFNREFLDLYSICKLSLEDILEQFQQQVMVEADFMSGAGNQIAELAQTCNVAQLKTANVKVNQAGVLLCAVGGIGGINLRMASAAQQCVDIILDMFVSSDEQVETQSCSGFKQLKDQFDEVYEEIVACEDEFWK